MSIRSIATLQAAHVTYAQQGFRFIKINNLGVIGSPGGHSGLGSQDYIEILAGDACGQFTSADNVAGTKFIDDIEYIVSFKNLTQNLVGGGLHTLEVGAESLSRDNYAQTPGDYNPDGGFAGYMDLEAQDEIFGRFNRICVFKTAGSHILGRLILTLGPGRTKIKESYGA